MIDERPRRRINHKVANALARLAKAGDPDAMEALACEMYGLAEAIIHRRRWWIEGAEFEDLVQEGLHNLHDTLRCWDERITKWTSFAGFVIERDMREAIRTAIRKKHLIHLEAASLNVTVGRGDGRDDDDRLALWMLPDSSGLGANPVDVLCTGEGDGNLVLATLRESATEIEQAATLRVMFRGEAYKVVAKDLGRTAKSIDNALWRVKQRTMRRLLALADNGELDEDTAARIRRLARGRTEAASR